MKRKQSYGAYTVNSYLVSELELLKIGNKSNMSYKKHNNSALEMQTKTNMQRKRQIKKSHTVTAC